MKILLVQTGFLGDVILSTPVINRLLSIYPNSKLTLLTTPEASILFNGDTRLSEVIIFDKRKKDKSLFGLLRKARELKSKKFDIVFSLHKSYRTACLLWLSRIPLRYGFKESRFSWLYTKSASRKDLKHEVLRNLAILRNINEEPSEDLAEMSLAVARCKEVEEIFKPLNGCRVIGIAPGSVWATKRWTVHGYSVLAKEFLKRGYAVLILGGKEDQAVADTVTKYCCDTNLVNLVGQIDLSLSAAVISRLELLITNDSAPLHLASAVKTPVVAVFCATIPEFGFYPWKVRHEIVELKGLPCRPCGRHGQQSCPQRTNACQINIKPEDVINACDKILQSELAQNRAQVV